MQIDCLADWLLTWLNNWLTVWLADWLTDWLTNTLTDSLTDWLTGCSTDWLSDPPTNSRNQSFTLHFCVQCYICSIQCSCIVRLCIWKAWIWKEWLCKPRHNYVEATFFFISFSFLHKFFVFKKWSSCVCWSIPHSLINMGFQK